MFRENDTEFDFKYVKFLVVRNIMSLRFYGGTAARPLKHSLGVVMVLLDDPSLLNSI